MQFALRISDRIMTSTTRKLELRDKKQRTRNALSSRQMGKLAAARLLLRSPSVRQADGEPGASQPNLPTQHPDQHLLARERYSV